MSAQPLGYDKLGCDFPDARLRWLLVQSLQEKHMPLGHLLADRSGRVQLHPKLNPQSNDNTGWPIGVEGIQSKQQRLRNEKVF